MNSKNAAENITTWMRDTNERLTAWITVIDHKLGRSQLMAFRTDVEAEIARVRGDHTYDECLAQFQRQLDDARDESTLIALMYSLGPGNSNVGR